MQQQQQQRTNEAIGRAPTRGCALHCHTLQRYPSTELRPPPHRPLIASLHSHHALAAASLIRPHELGDAGVAATADHVVVSAGPQAASFILP